MSKLFAATIFVSLIVGGARPAAAEAGGRSTICRHLAEADRRAQPFDDQEYTSNIRYLEKSKVVKNFRLRVVTKGMHKMRIAFLAPGQVRGMRILIVDPETMYTYLPQYRRVRRVAAHARNQGFMGTNLYHEDISEHRYSSRWNCRPRQTTDEGWVLDLRPRPGVSTGYSKLRLTIGRTRRQTERVEYYVDGRHVKSQMREGWRTMAGLEMAGLIRFVSHDRDAETRVEFTEWRVNTGIPDSAFTRRALLRGD
jgi:outer membrane lipoprotein-sorting protein